MQRAIYEAHYEAIYKYIRYVTNDTKLTDDYVQETFYRFFQKEYVSQERIHLLKIARSLVAHHCRKHSLFQLADEPATSITLPEELVLQSTELEPFYTALQQLKWQYREMLVLRSIEGYSMQETVEIVSCHEAKVRLREEKSIQALRAVVSGEQERQFEQLKEVQISAEKKQRELDKLIRRLQKNTLPWQVFAVIFCLLMFSYFFFLAWAEKQNRPVQTSSELIAVYQVIGEGNPYSIWQMWVARSSDARVLAKYESALQGASQVKAPEQLEEVSRTFRFAYRDGTAASYALYDTNNHVYFYDVEQAIYYEIAAGQDDNPLPYLDNLNVAGFYFKAFLALSVLFLLVDLFIGRKMRVEGDNKRSLPRHSTQWQTIVLMSAFGLVFVLVFVVPNVHYFVVASILMLATLLNLLLEQKFGRNSWRMLQMTVDGFWFVFTLMNMFLM